MARSDSLGMFWFDEPVVKVSKAALKVKRMAPERTWERPDYLPNLAEALRFDVPLFTDHELADLALQCKLTGKVHEFVWDIECYPNYFLVAFESVTLGKIVFFEQGNWEGGPQLDKAKMLWLLETFCHVSFNGFHYDAPIAALALAGHTTDQLYQATYEIIVEEIKPHDVLRARKVKKLVFNHIDIKEVAPLDASLKAYSGRIHARRMQDLPFVPGTVLTWEQICVLRWYCMNDLANTKGLRLYLAEQLELRMVLSAEYRTDLRSKSDAQIAEAVIAAEIERLSGVRAQRPTIEIGTTYYYRVPSFLKYQSALMQWVLNVVASAPFVVDETGSIGLPEQLKDFDINIAGGTYRMGVGGLHSTESTVMHAADKDYVVSDHDMVSFYPYIILNQQLYPKHLGTLFLQVYRTIVERRVAAKKAGNTATANTLKIVINGSFGKLGSKYSILYAPDLLFQTTISGQLSLLMLIERFELAGINVVSANTDGVVIRCHRSMLGVRDAIIKQYEHDTQYETEETRYAALYSRDVNNYVAVKQKFDKATKQWTEEVTGAKTKGAFADPGLQKNPTNGICVDAVVKLLTERVPVHETIYKCKDITKFVSVRAVKGGAVKVWDYSPPPTHKTKEELIQLAGYEPYGKDWLPDAFAGNDEAMSTDQAYTAACAAFSRPSRSEFLGKCIRWYYGKDVGGEIIYARSGNKVPRSDGAQPLMDLPDAFPTDIDYEWYIAEAEKILQDIGYA